MRIRPASAFRSRAGGSGRNARGLRLFVFETAAALSLKKSFLSFKTRFEPTAARIAFLVAESPLAKRERAVHANSKIVSALWSHCSMRWPASRESSSSRAFSLSSANRCLPYSEFGKQAREIADQVAITGADDYGVKNR